MRRLSNSLTFAAQRSTTPRPTPPKIHTARVNAQRKYIDLTNNSKIEMQNIVKKDVKARRNEWKHDHYRVSSSFSVC